MNIPLKDYWHLLVDYLKPQWLRVLWLSVLLLGSIGLQLLGPQLVRAFIDSAIAGTAVNMLILIALAYIGVVLVQQAANVFATYLSENVGWMATNALRLALTAHCLNLDLSFHKTRTAGELIERIDGDVTALSNFFSRFVTGVLGHLLLLAGILILLFREDWRVGSVLSVLSFVALYSLMRVRTITIPRWAALREINAKFFGFLSEHLVATEDLRANGATAYALRRLDELLREWWPIRRSAFLGYLLVLTTSDVIFGTGFTLAYALGAYLSGAGLMSLGSVYLIFSYTGLLQLPINQLRDQLQDLQTAGASIGRVAELFGMRSKIQDGPGLDLPAGALAVDFRDVTFSYDTGESVLQDITFHLAPGKVLGLLGRTGSGKTTLARLLFRLYDPAQGEIRLGNVPLREARVKDLRGRSAMVTQDVQLFNANVRDNLTFFDSALRDEQILDHLEQLGLSSWLQSLPQGLDTELESGGGLSAGQAQLLAFGRIFLKNPGLVILDEASAHLDPATERLIESALNRLLSQRTGIIIAHRLETVQRVDDILILDSGRIVEYGTRVMLQADPGSRFSQLLRTGLVEALA
jgi:ATP-binding cassette, subfamily B, bacterial